MSIRYIDCDEARIMPSETEYHVDLEWYGGETVKNLEAKRLFPVSGLSQYIALLDASGKEVAIVRNIDHLMPESKKVLLTVLNEYYMVPKIISVLDKHDKFGVLKFTVETERGIRTIEIRNRHNDLKLMYEGRVLIRDADDNRYEIENIDALDRHSRSLLNGEL